MNELLAGGVTVVTSLLQVAVALLNIIGLFKIFQKMGMPGWKGIIPIYNTYGLYNVLWEKKYFWVYFVAQLCLGVFKPDGSNLLVSLVILVMSVLTIVLGMKLYIKLAKAFGKGTGFGVLTFFFAPICLAILGFGSAEYEGAQKN